ncbi:3-(3-hydroxy-phenyl)propionate hydroxylase [Microdochium nivale]|nr:3-(3-hydroxy-phenyl)propionate hydroxylase [Microdochium nivale]
MQQETDILIVGAGPTGLVMALELASRGVSFRLVDKADTASRQSRALVMHARTLELLARHGVRDQLIAAGFQPSGASVFVNGSLVTAVDLPNISALVTGCARVSPIFIAQAETERILLARLETRYNIVPERGVTVKDIRQDAHDVTVTIENPNPSSSPTTNATKDTVVLRCKYVVGADGAHSVVRHSCPSMTFDGAPYRQDFILCDTHVRPSPSFQGATDRFHFCLGDGLLVMIPLKEGMMRLVASRSGRWAAGDGSGVATSSNAEEQEPGLHDFQDFMDHMCPGFGELHDPVWLTRYRLHHRGVNRYREGRLFVAGDAAHIHSPAGGQGMNTGIGDAANLGWKLATAIQQQQSQRGISDNNDYVDMLLDSYHAERHPVGQKLLASTDRLFTWLTWDNPLFLLLRNTLLPWILPRALTAVAPQKSQVRAFRFMTQLAIRYARSPVVGTATGFATAAAAAAAAAASGNCYRPVLGGYRAPDGRIAAVGWNRMETKNNEEDKEEEKWLIQSLAGDRHNLILFSGAGDRAATQTDLEAARVRFLEAAATAGAGAGAADVHVVYSREAAAQISKQPPPAVNTEVGGRRAHVDVDDDGERDGAAAPSLHAQYGFHNRAGYVYVRPDLYVAHIGHLESLEELMENLGRPGM